jgi:hypothetical protein
LSARWDEGRSAPFIASPLVASPFGARIAVLIAVGVAILLGTATGCATAPSLDSEREATTPERMGALRRPGPPRRVLLISVAGLQASDFLDVWGHVASDLERVRMPRLATLAREGVVGERARPPAPGASYASHATIVTGTRPARHGVVADTTLDEGGSRLQPFWDNRLMKKTALWDAAIGRGVLSLGWPTTMGARIELLVPDSRPTDPLVSWLAHLDRQANPTLVRELEAMAREAGVAIAKRDDSGARKSGDGKGGEGANSARSGGRDPLSWPTPAERDAAFAGLACHVVDSERDPGLWLIRLAETESVFATAGVGSEEVDAALMRIDAAIGRIVDCLAAREQLAETAIFVVGDIAYQPVHTRVDPNVALVAAGLVGRDPRSEAGVRSWLALVSPIGRVAYVYARDASHAITAREILEAESKRTGTFRVVPAARLAEIGADPQAWFGLGAGPGYTFGQGLLKPVIRPSERRSVGGAFPFREVAGDEASVGFVAWGRGIRRQVRVPELELADLAPTIAALLGLRLDDDLDGEPLIGILRASVPAPPPGPKRLGVGSDADADRAIRDLGGSRPSGSRSGGGRSR